MRLPAIPDYRREIHTLLNRGESVHQLQRAIHGGQVAHERGRRRQEMAAISGAHALLTNIVLAWNTNRMDSVVARLNHDGNGIEEDWLRRIGPAHFSHINFRGRSGSTSSGTRTCWSSAPPGAVRPSTASETHGNVPEAGMPAMGWSADVQW
ncbi:Tn3 family transposase [Piscinibacter aquaticus]|uniref:Tn3 family transposase n=1 Tax=Piscinibacter aquaticus TaxID=392597 RepID=A0A5C6TQ64_9BURK|nr:Tn3 family transposase [Piscinibacter aquaticus]